MAPRLGTIAVALGLGLAAPAPALTGPLAKALDQLAARQDPVAGGVDEGPGTDAVYSAWAALAVTAAGEDPGRWRSGLATLADAVARPVRRPMLGELELIAVAARAAGLDPGWVGGRDPVRRVRGAQRADGSIGDAAATTAWGILALRAGGLGPRARAVRRARDALVRGQNRDGGWSNAPPTPRLQPQHDRGGGAGAVGGRRAAPGGRSSRGRGASSPGARTATAASRRSWAVAAGPSPRPG